MPGRIVPLVTDHIYHVFNRGIDRRITFSGKKEYSRAWKAILFYRYLHPPTRLSYFLSLGSDRRQEILSRLGKERTHVEVLAYCLMPNHFHFVLQQATNTGISKFMSQFQNSYTRYFNTLHQRTGSLFLDQFKAKLIETDELLHHVIRYIHLNPYTSVLVETHKKLIDYQWSSFREYLGLQSGFCSQTYSHGTFPAPADYKKFVFDQADYQRHLAEMKHLVYDD